MSTPDVTSALQRQQYAFAAYIRDPEQNPAPEGIESRRMAMYRELFFSNVEGFISANFPVLRQILNDAQWYALIQDYFARHRAQTPYFSRIPEEFLDYLQNERAAQASDPAFMPELVHYEWIEMALTIAAGDTPVSDPVLQGDPLGYRIVLSRLARPLAYQFPVHRIAPDYQPEVAPEQPTCLVVYRNPEDEVRFMELNPVTYRLVQLLQNHPDTEARPWLLEIAEELQHPDPDVILQGGSTVLSELAVRGIIARSRSES